ncbi:MULTISPECIES: DUF402 domain-containing protein [unclassified Microbacterium]|uniref:DUF402 domain-containing protein n=1 Tax=unclassified Microbacterium TaxID=2609290 RepID=UPI0012F88EF6|nr:DUF402 domain-containing protein [Microbacterium sp. MAH-37]MVQ42932.1 DUF402 domain-containing protein [Microbacterium sp. MAH-37]
MRLPLGSADVSASGGSAVLTGRRGEPWSDIASLPMSLADATALLEDSDLAAAHADPAFLSAVPSDDTDAPRFAPGAPILWRYGRYIETARVIRDDERGLVVWIPSGSARLVSVPADGRSPREVPLAERFSVPWRIEEAHWRGPGVVRVAPAGMPWSVWFFRSSDGTPEGTYVNLELPHRRTTGENAGVFSRDLVLDLWVDAGHPGSEDIWVKDADELEAAVQQDRFTAEQADAVRAIADHAVREFVASGGWPLDERWETWTPSEEIDVPVQLPAGAAMDAARRRSGSTSLEG